MILAAETGVILDVNPFLTELLGYSRETFLGKELWELGFFKDIAASKANFIKLQQNEYIRYDNLPLETAHGQRINVEFVSNVYQVDHHNVIQCNIRDITERKRAEEAERLARIHAETLAAASQSLTQSLELESVLDKLLEYLRQVVPYDGANIMLLENGSHLRIRSARGYEKLGGLKNIRARAFDAHNTPNLWKVMQTKQSCVVNDTRANPDWIFLEGVEHVRSWLGVPLMVNDHIIGMYSLDKAEPDYFKSKEIRLVESLASQAAVAIRNANLFESVQKELSERKRAEESLRESNLIIEEIINTMPVRVFWKDKNLVYLGCNLAFARDAGFTDPKDIIGKDDYLMGWRDQAELYRGDDRQVIESGKPKLLIEKASTTPEGSVTTLLTSKVPLRSSTGDIIGVLGTYMDITDRKQSEEKIQQQLKRLSALSVIDVAISASFDLRINLSILLEQVTTQLQVDAADVLLHNPTMLTLEFNAGYGFRTRGGSKLRLRLGESYAGKAVLERRLIHVPDISKADPPFVRTGLIDGEGFVAYYAVPLIAKGQVKGVLEIFHRARLNPDQEWLDFLDTLAGQAAIAIDNAELFNNLHRSNAELMQAYDATIEGWSRALDLRDKETEGHTQRVTEMALRLAQTMGQSDEELMHIRRGGLLHDIGKLGVPDGILLKPEPLTDEDWVLMKRHPQYAYDLLAPIDYLRHALDIPYCHHEKWDGTGYPRGLKGEEIPLAARIFAIVDVWDALRSDRPYRKGWSEDKVREHIRQQSSAHFDPNVVDAFLRLMG